MGESPGKVGVSFDGLTLLGRLLCALALQEIEDRS
jgi:hypothetical protein